MAKRLVCQNVAIFFPSLIKCFFCIQKDYLSPFTTVSMPFKNMDEAHIGVHCAIFLLI